MNETMKPELPDPRGEIEIELAGATYVLRPTFGGLKALRRALAGESLVKTTRRFIEADFGVEEVEAVLATCIVEKKPPANLGALVVAAGVGHFGAPITAFLLGACSGGREKNAATPETETTPAAT